MMIRTRHVFLGLTLVLLLFQAVPVLGQAAQPTDGDGEEKIEITADESITGIEGGIKIEAKGNVKIKRGETTLKADEVKMNRKTTVVEAKGNVSMEDPQGTLKADGLRLNLGQETGEIENGEIFIKQNQLSVSGKRFQKFSGQSYHIDEGFFTTCLCKSGPPSWKISADKIDLTPEGEGIITNGYFYIFDIPVFYFPYAHFPVRTERKSGLLFPKIGSSTDDGFRYEQPFFWAISKSSDATFEFNLETDTRIGLLGEYRTVLSRNASARFNLAYFNEGFRHNAAADIKDKTIADPHIPEDRWTAIATHRHTPSASWMTYSDISAFSDDLFTRELVDRFDLAASRESDIRRSRFGSSRFGFLKSWDDTYLRGELKFFQDFIQNDKTTYQKTPQLTFWGRRDLGKNTSEFRWRAEVVNYIRRDPGDGLRLDLRPEIVVPFRLPSYLFGSVKLAPRQTLYHLYSSTKGSSDRNISRELIEIRNHVGTSLGRIYNWNSAKLRKIKHIIEPELSYLFVSGSHQSDIPIMDGVDRISRRNVLTFSLTNRLWGKYGQRPKGPPADQDVELVNPAAPSNVQELGWFKMAMSYDIDKERNGGDSLSDLDMNLRLTPKNFFRIELGGGINPGPWHVTQGTSTFTVFDPRPITHRVMDQDFMRPNSLSMSFRYVRDGPLGFFSEDANIDLSTPATVAYCLVHPLDPRCPGTAFDKDVVGQLNGNLMYHVTNHLLFFFDSSYDVREARFPGVRGAFKILSQCECWTMTFSLKKNVNPDKTSFGFSFNLLGLGSQNTESEGLLKGFGFFQ